MAMPDAWLDGYRWASGKDPLCGLDSEIALDRLGHKGHERVLWWRGVEAFYLEQELEDIGPDDWAKEAK